MVFRTSIQREMDRFFARLNDEEFDIRAVTKGAFTKARAKLKHTAFISLMHSSLKIFYAHAPVEKWEDFRVLAVDGSRLNLPNHPSIEEEFGPFDNEVKQARCSLLYDVINMVPVDSQISSLSTGERQLLIEHLDQLQRGDLLLMDRGYPAQWLFLVLASKDIDFCARLSDYNWQAAADFAQSPKEQMQLSFKVAKKYHGLLQKHGINTEQSLTIRMVKVQLDTGETEILCTSLTDQTRFPVEIFGQLYHRRWQAEEAFKMLKSRAELESFSGKTARAVRQDFHAKVFAMSLCSIYALPIEQKVRREYLAAENLKHAQKINRTNALSATYDLIVPAILKQKFTKLINYFDDLLYRTREIIRPNRKQPRRHRTPKKYHMAYKKL